jgi:hypothetical protein
MLMAAPGMIPRGTINILVTEWMSPRAANAEMGNHTAVIFPINEEHPEAMYTAIQTFICCVFVVDKEAEWLHWKKFLLC